MIIVKSQTYTLVLAAHGSKDDPRCSAPVERHAAHLRCTGRWKDVLCIYWKQAPHFRDLFSLTSSGEIVVVPVMTASGYYATTILPQEIRAADPDRAQGVVISSPVGESSLIPALIAAEARPHTGEANTGGIHILVVGHGTRRDPQRSGATALRHAHSLAGTGRFASVRAAFLEQDPTIADAMDVIPQGETVVVVPFLIASGGHGADDIPLALGLPKGCRKAMVEGRTVHFGVAVGESEQLVEIIEHQARHAIESARDSHSVPAEHTGRVTLIGAGPGDPELITVKGLKALRCADVVLYDRLAPRALLEEAPSRAERIDVGKHAGRPTPSQPWINELILDHARRGRHVVRLKGGDPFVFGRGGEEAMACVESGIPCEVIPGVTSALAAGAACGVPVTHRGVSASVALVTAVTDWEHPANTPGDEVQIDTVAHADTLCIYMGLAELRRVADRLIGLGRDPETPVIAISRATCADQKEIAGTLRTIATLVAAESLPSPVVTLVGDVVLLREQLLAERAHA